MSFAVKSVSSALDATHRCTVIGPVTSTASLERLGLEDEHVRPLATAAGRAPREPKNAGDSFWSAGPGVRRSRSRSTGLRKRAHACSIPAPSAGSSPIAQ